jgi:oligosaccharide translocation protein RFT1
MGTLVKCVTTFSLVLLDWGVVAFGAAQLLYAVTVFGIFAVSMVRSMGSGGGGMSGGVVALYTPGRLPAAAAAAAADDDDDDHKSESVAASEDACFGCCRRSTYSLLQTFSVQSGLKHLLTEGNRLVLLTAPAVVRGEFAAVTNYGSLAVRILLQPTEDAARTMFAKLGGDSKPGAEANTAASGGTKDQEESENDKGDAGKSLSTAIKATANSHLAVELLLLSLRLVGTLGLIIAALGPPYCSTVVKLLLGPKWQNTDVAGGLATFCLYVLCLAVNGVTEAFVMATAAQSTISTLSATMAFTYAVYALLALGDPYLTGTPGLLELLGIRGLILADCVNMLLRGATALSFAQARTVEMIGSPLEIGRAMPSMASLVAVVAAAVATRASESVFADGPLAGGATPGLRGLLLHIGVGAVSGIVVLGVLYVSDGATLKAAWARVRGKVDEEKPKQD